MQLKKQWVCYRNKSPTASWTSKVEQIQIPREPSIPHQTLLFQLFNCCSDSHLQ